MKINTLDVAAVRGGAAFTGACSPWTSLSALATSHVLAPNPVMTRQVPAMKTQTAALAAVLPTATDIRKQYVHKTRVNAGGDGASGPHPEREPA